MLVFVHFYSLYNYFLFNIYFVLSSGDASCVRGTVSTHVIVLLYLSDIIEENDVDSKDATEGEKHVMDSDFSLQNPTLQDQEDSQLEISECEGAAFKDYGMISGFSSHGSAGFHIQERPRLQLELPRAPSGEKEGLAIGRATELEKDGGRSPIVSKSGSQCLVGQRGKGIAVKSNEDDMDCIREGLGDTVQKVQAVAKEVEVSERILDPLTQQVETTTVEATMLEASTLERSVELLPVSKEVHTTEVAVEAPATAVQEGAELLLKPPSTSLSEVKAGREKEQKELDDLEPENMFAPENLYSPEKRTWKDLSELLRGTDSPVPVSETSRRTRSRTAKEVDAEMVTKVTPKKGKGHKVGGTSSQKQARVATTK